MKKHMEQGYTDTSFGVSATEADIRFPSSHSLIPNTVPLP